MPRPPAPPPVSWLLSPIQPSVLGTPSSKAPRSSIPSPPAKNIVTSTGLGRGGGASKKTEQRQAERRRKDGVRNTSSKASWLQSPSGGTYFSGKQVGSLTLDAFLRRLENQCRPLGGCHTRWTVSSLPGPVPGPPGGRRGDVTGLSAKTGQRLLQVPLAATTGTALLRAEACLTPESLHPELERGRGGGRQRPH